MGAASGTPASKQLAEELCSVGKELSIDESLMILRFWREIASTRKIKTKQIQKHTKGKSKTLSLSSPKYKPRSGSSVSLSSEISKEEFFQLFDQISHTEEFATHYPILKKKNAIEYLFLAFDSANKSQISLEEFITGLSVLSSGTFKQKAEMIFRSCDMDNNGIITREELSKSLRKGIRGAISVLKKEFPDISPEELLKITGKMDELSVQRTVDHIFIVCNAADSGITLADWLEQHDTDPALQHLLRAMTSSQSNDENNTSFSQIFPIHPQLLG